jgi:hypothetical protein
MQTFINSTVLFVTMTVPLLNIGAEELFPENLFQYYVDQAVKFVFGVENPIIQRGDSLEPQIIGIKDYSIQGLLSADGVLDKIYLRKITDTFLQKMLENYAMQTSPISLELAIDLGLTTELSRLIIAREEFIPLIAHEVQHIAYLSLDTTQRTAVTNEVKRRLGDKFYSLGAPIKKYYLERGRNENELDGLIANELLSECRRSIHSITDLKIGHLSMTNNNFETLLPIMPVMLEVARNYAYSKDMLINEGVYKLDFLEGQIKTFNATGKLQISVIPHLDPYELPGRYITIDNV